MVIRAVAVISILWAGVLLSLSFRSTFFPAGIYPNPPKSVMNDAELHAIDDGYESLRVGRHESDRAYFKRVTESVFARLIHYWPENREYTSVSLFDNYLMWGMGFFPSYEHFHNYEFLMHQKALNRGYGFCSQASRVLYSVLRESGKRGIIMNHANHVVVEMISDDGGRYVADADYGVFIPLSLDELQVSPDVVRKYYEKYPRRLDDLVSIYRDGFSRAAQSSVFEEQLLFEQKMYGYQWFVSVFFVFLSCVLVWSIGKKRHPQ